MAVSVDPSPAPAAGSRTIGVELERVRLEHRARRVEFAIEALRGIADARAPQPPPPALTQAIEDFRQELARLRRRIAEL